MTSFIDRLIRAFSPAPPLVSREGVRVVTGVVSLFGAEMLERGEDGRRTVRVILDRWCVKGGHMGPPRLFVTVVIDAIPAWLAGIEPAQLFSARVRFTGHGRAELLEVLNVEADQNGALARLSSQLWRADERRDERFGRLARSRHTGWYAAPATWTGHPIQLDLETRHDDELPATLRTAAALWDDEAGWNARIENYAVRYFFDMEKEFPPPGGSSPVSPGEVRAMLRIASVSVDAEGIFEFWYEATEPFLRFAELRIGGSLQEGPDFGEFM